MRPDPDIAMDAAERLRCTPGLEAQDIALKVIDGTVLLVGIVRSDAERALAEEVVREVPGVVGLADDLSVWLRSASAPPDPQIAREAVAMLRHQLPEQIGQLQLTIRNGQVVVTGELDWHYQRDLVESTIRSLRGVALLTNQIRVREQPLK